MDQFDDAFFDGFFDDDFLQLGSTSEQNFRHAQTSEEEIQSHIVQLIPKNYIKKATMGCEFI